LGQELVGVKETASPTLLTWFAGVVTVGRALTMMVKAALVAVAPSLSVTVILVVA
jgi:hypothetical protein